MNSYKGFNMKSPNKACLYSCGIVFCYLLLALIAVVVTYELIDTMVFSLRHPVRSTNFKKVTTHDAPGLLLLALVCSDADSRF